MPCSICRQSGHNKTTCTATTATDLWNHCVTLGLVSHRLGFYIPIELRKLISQFATPTLPYLKSLGPPRKTPNSFTWHGGRARRGLKYTGNSFCMRDLMTQWSFRRRGESNIYPAPYLSTRRKNTGTSQYLKTIVGDDWTFTGNLSNRPLQYIAGEPTEGVYTDCNASFRRSINAVSCPA